MKKKLEESGGLTFQIPQFSAEYGMRRVPTVKKIKLQKLDKSLRIKIPKEKKGGLKTKLTAKMVGDSLDLILSQTKTKETEEEEEDEEDDEDDDEDEAEHLSNQSRVRPLSSTSSSFSSSSFSSRRSSAERVRELILLSCPFLFLLVANVSHQFILGPLYIHSYSAAVL